MKKNWMLTALYSIIVLFFSAMAGVTAWHMGRWLYERLTYRFKVWGKGSLDSLIQDMETILRENERLKGILKQQQENDVQEV